MITFEKLTIIVLASNEQESLRETLKKLADYCEPKDIEEIIVFLKSVDCPAEKEYKKIVEEGWLPFSNRLCVQKISGYAAMFYEAPKLVHSSHFLCIGADLEMDLNSVPELIKVSKHHPDAIICASKWDKDSTRENGRFIHKMCGRFINYVLNKIIGSNATEILSITKIYPTDLYRKMNFANGEEAFYGFSIKPLVYKASYVEVPTNYIRRHERKSNYTSLWYMKFSYNFIKTAIKLKHEKLIRKNDN